MNEKYDVAIVGAGPAGISAACVLADNGINAVVLERGNSQGRKIYPEGFFTGMTCQASFPILPKKIVLSSEI